MSQGLLKLPVVGTFSGLTEQGYINTALAALASANAGSSAPTTGGTGLSALSNISWLDQSLTPNVEKIRDNADTAWIPRWMIDQTGKVAAPYHSGTNPQTGTTYTVLATDLGKIVSFTNAASIAVTLPQATTAGFGKGFWCIVKCLSGSTGSATITPTTSTIDGGATLVLAPGQSAVICSDGTNYLTSFVNAARLDKSNTMTASTPFWFQYSDDGAGSGPLLMQERISASAAANDLIAEQRWRGRNASGTTRDYIELSGIILNATAGAEQSALRLVAWSAGAAAVQWYLGRSITASGLTDQGVGTVNATGIYVNNVAVGAPAVAIYQNQQASNTAGPNPSSGSWQVWAFNTEVTDPSGIGSLSGNQVTLGAGTYVMWIIVPSPGASGPAAIQAKYRLRNATDSTTTILSVNSGMYAGLNANAVIFAYVTIAGSKAFQIEVYRSSATNAWLYNQGDIEVYGTWMIQKVA